MNSLQFKGLSVIVSVLILAVIGYLFNYYNSQAFSGIAYYLIVVLTYMLLMSSISIIYYVLGKFGIKPFGLFSFLWKRPTPMEILTIGKIKSSIYDTILTLMDRNAYTAILFFVFIYYFFPPLNGVSTIVSGFMISIVLGITMLTYLIYTGIMLKLMEYKLEVAYPNINENDKLNVNEINEIIASKLI